MEGATQATGNGTRHQVAPPPPPAAAEPGRLSKLSPASRVEARMLLPTLKEEGGKGGREGET